MSRLRIRGGRVLTLGAAGAVHDPGEVLIEDEWITSVGPQGSTAPAPDEEVIEAPGGLVLPGLVNAHSHSTDSLVPGTAPTLPLEAWSQFTEAGRAGRTPREIYLSAALAGIEALRTGTTTILDHLRLSPRLSLEGLEAAAQACLDVGIRGVIAPVLSDLSVAETLPLDLIDLPAAHADAMRRTPAPWTEQADVCEAFIQKWKTRLGVQVGPSAPHRCSDALLERCGELAERHAVRLHMHFLETVPQAIVAARRFAQGPARHLADLGLLKNASLVHCVHADDVDTIAASGAVVVHCPLANLRLASGVMSWKAFADRGVRLALGTDGVLCNDSLSMFTVMKVAGMLHSVDPRPQPKEVLRAAVDGGARACGLTKGGALEPGCRADLIILDRSSSRDPYSQAVYAEEWRPVRTVIVGGRVVMHDGRITTLDEQAILDEAAEASRALVARNTTLYHYAEAVSAPMQHLVKRAQEVYASTRSGGRRSGYSN